MHIGHDHTAAYELQHNGHLRVSDEYYEEKDLGVYINIDLKPSTQCIKSVHGTMSVLWVVIGLLHTGMVSTLG